MNGKEGLYQTLKMILNIDISYIIDDLIENYSSPIIPSNIDFNQISIDLETPYGVASLITKDHDKKILYIEHTISDNYAEVYRLNLDSNTRDFLSLVGATVEIRDKAVIVNNIEKDYAYFFDGEVIASDDISGIRKFLEVYNKKDLANKIALYKEDAARRLAYEYLNGSLDASMLYDNSLVINISSKGNLSVSIYGHDLTWIYHECTRNKIYQKSHLARRIFNLYRGIINQENYEDAQILIRNRNFPMGFSFEDYNNQESSINNILIEIAGSPIFSSHNSYTSLVRETIQKYYQSIKNNPFLFDEYEGAPNDKKRELKKNNYIQEIILNNRDIM